MSSEKLNVSVVLLTKNEEHNIDACLGSCSFAKEIIVVDDESTDGTVAKAKAFGAKVFTRALAGNWGEQQTFAISKASCEWVFLIDADERVSPLLAQNLAKTLEQNPQKLFGFNGKTITTPAEKLTAFCARTGLCGFYREKAPGSKGKSIRPSAHPFLRKSYPDTSFISRTETGRPISESLRNTQRFLQRNMSPRENTAVL